MPSRLKKPGVKAQDILISALCNKRYGEQISLNLLPENFISGNGKNSGGDYPLHVAVQYCSFTITLCSSLISTFDADIHAKDLLGRTPLMLCLYRRRLGNDSACTDETVLSVMRYLIQHGADINAQDIQGRNSLHHAVIQDSHQAVLNLIKAGANISTCDNFGRSPLDLLWEEILLFHCPIKNLMTCILSGHSSSLIGDNTQNVRQLLQEKLKVMTTFLEAGAIFENEICQQWILCTFLHFKLDKYVPLTLGRGIFPQQALQVDDVEASCIDIDSGILYLPDLTISPFTLALWMQNFDIALYLYNNRFLTGADLDV
ncbi:ankyrin repeat family protein [Elysia marginata]|uniref:Ankyrin repeat family protein n=1 Tax=Elysia marginata TaxID=1093978 RepID=A0AAV4J3D0_9GAST|nr:ankyrin repeat family protein [Elysia marginata]